MSATDLPVREPPRPPAWLRHIPEITNVSESEALYFAGAALSLLDAVARSDAPWLGAWRRRLALKSAAAISLTVMKRREDEAALRDAFALSRPGQDLGPAGRAYAAFRALSDRGDPFRARNPHRGRGKTPVAAQRRKSRGDRGGAPARHPAKAGPGPCGLRRSHRLDAEPRR